MSRSGLAACPQAVLYKCFFFNASWELASLPGWFPVMLWHSSVTRIPETQGWRCLSCLVLSTFISCWHFLLFLGSSMCVVRITHVNWGSSLLERAAKASCDLGALAVLGTTGNLWTASNSFYFGYCVTTQWLLLQFVAHGDWIQIHHVSRVYS